MTAFASKAQRRLLHKLHPELARSMEAQTTNPSRLPEHVPIKAAKHRHRRPR